MADGCRVEGRLATPPAGKGAKAGDQPLFKVECESREAEPVAVGLANPDEPDVVFLVPVGTDTTATTIRAELRRVARHPLTDLPAVLERAGRCGTLQTLEVPDQDGDGKPEQLYLSLPELAALSTHSTESTNPSTPICDQVTAETRSTGVLVMSGRKSKHFDEVSGVVRLSVEECFVPAPPSDDDVDPSAPPPITPL